MKSRKLVKNKSNAFKKKKSSIKKGGSKRKYSKKRITKGGMQQHHLKNLPNHLLVKIQRLHDDIVDVAKGSISEVSWRTRWQQLIKSHPNHTPSLEYERRYQLNHLQSSIWSKKIGLSPVSREGGTEIERVAAREREIERKEKMFEAVLAQKKYNENAQSVLLARSQRSKTPPFTAKKQKSNRAAGKTRRNSTRNAAKKRRKQISKYLSNRPTTTRMSISP